MRLLFIINTPAQAHTWHYIIKDLLAKGHTVKILARDYGDTVNLIGTFGFQYDSFKLKGSRILRFLRLLEHLQTCYKLSRKFEPSIVIGFGVDAAITAVRLKKLCIVFNDSEGLPVQRYLNKLFASTILTPECFTEDLGKKHIRIKGYKELAYLHPNYFKPDPSVLNELGVAINEKYAILRLNAFDAVHDIGEHGFTVANQIELVKELKKYARIFISPEGNLSKELEEYRLPISFDRIHHALYYAQLLVTDTQTMATESAILGTPAIRSNTFVGRNRLGNFIELENKYGLTYSFSKAEMAIQKSIELIKQPDLKEKYTAKQHKLLSDKIDCTQFMVNFIVNYPESIKKQRREKGL